MDYSIEKANTYIKNNKNKVNPQYRLKYHMAPPIGWMNDPNGLVYFNSNYHIFYQYYPYKSSWGPMHWGHIITKDFINYEDLEVALAPDEIEEFGCFSGGAIIDDDKINLVYTRHFEAPNIKKESNFLAVSNDTIHYKKMDYCLFDNNTLPKNYSRIDFRDPAPYKIDNNYYILMGCKDESENKGIIVVLKSDKLKDFKYDFTIGPFYELGDMAECPSLFRLDNKDILVVSGCNVKEKNNSFKNVSSSCFIVGNIDFLNKKMDVDFIKEIDKGDAFYAPQFISNSSAPIMIGWFDMWNHEYLTDKLNHYWAGAFSLPRKLVYKNNNIYQRPVDIKSYFELDESNRVSHASIIEVVSKNDFRLNFKAINGNFIIGYLNNKIYLENLNSNNLNRTVRYQEITGPVNLEIYLDISGVEIFINDGLYTISSRIYLDSDYDLEITGNPVIKKYKMK